MSKVRINDLARELEVKSKAILDVLDVVGVTEKKTHSSSLEEDEAERVRQALISSRQRGTSSRHSGNGDGDSRPRIDLSKVSKPGDVLRAIQERQAERQSAASAPVRAVPQPAAPPVVAAAPAPAAPVAAKPPVVAPAPVAAAPVAAAPAPRPPAAVAAAPPPAAPAAAQPARPQSTAPAAPAPQPPPQPRAPQSSQPGPSAGSFRSGLPAQEAAKVPAPRRIVPQPRQAPQIVSQPAIASRAPSGPVVARPPLGAVAAPRPAIASTAPTAPVVGRPPVVAAAVPTQLTNPATGLPMGSRTVPPAPVATSPYAIPAQAAAAPPPALEPPASTAPYADEFGANAPARRVIRPQTGPRPSYSAPPPPPRSASTPAPGSSSSMQRGQPIFQRPRPGAGPGGPGSSPGGYQQRTPGSGYQGNNPNYQGAGGPGGAPGARRPMHPTRPGYTPGPGGARPGFGARPGMGARPGGPGAGMPPPGEAPRPQRPSAPKGRGRQQYPKSKEGPMKGFNPPPRFPGAGMMMSNEPVPITRKITITEGISVKDLAEKLDVRGKDLIAMLLMRGVFVTVNQSLDGDLVKDVAAQFGADTEIITFEDEMANESLENILAQDNIDELEVTRSPVVTVMGHVDHGKTSLLDAIRETDVAGGEAGGITQHIGAYKVRITKPDSPAFGREIVFLDTPGHEAFTRMRARGAKVTDIVVIVVAADDGVMPQTLEAVDHAKAANVPIIVAVNKIDKPEANPDRVMQQLGDRGVVPEAWGGDTIFVNVSAKKRLNLDLLLENICLTADVANLKATPGRSAVGTVVEAKLDRGRGAVASVLVQNGTLKSGDSFIVGNTFGKIRAMFDDRGRAIEEAGPSTPVEILGLESMPDAGDTFLVVADRDKAKGIAQYRRLKEREATLSKSSRVTLEGLSDQIKQAGTKELALILKGDVQGSVQVLADSLQKMSTDQVRIKVIHSGVGAITESDVLLASASNAIIIGFNVRPERKSADLADQENVEIRLHSIIYELQDEIRKAMLGLLDPVYRESYLGAATVLEVFKIPKVGLIAGCRVTDGVLRRDAEVRVKRGDVEVFKGRLSSLKRFKDDAREVSNGMECGVGISAFAELAAGDHIEAFTQERVAAELTAPKAPEPVVATTSA
jgi:translation initiation factor IF-2